MSAMPPPLPLDYAFEPTPPPQRGMTVGQAVAWAVILLVVALVAGSQFFQQNAGRQGTAPATAPAGTQPTTSPVAFNKPDFQMIGTARYAVGVKAFGTQMAEKVPALKTALPLDAFKPQLAELARTPADQLRAVMVYAELYGDAPAQVEQFLVREDLDPALRRDAETLRQAYTTEGGPLDPAERQRLLERHGWFAELALSHGKPEAAPDRIKALAPAKRTFVSLIAAAVMGIGALALGVGLGLAALVRYAQGKLLLRYQRQAQHPPYFLEAFAVYLAGLVVIPLTLRLFIADYRIGYSVLAGLVPVGLALAYPVLRGMRWAEVRQGMGLHGGTGVLREIGWGILGYIAALPVLALVLLLTSILAQWVKQNPTHPIVNEISGGGPWKIALMYFLAAAWAPVTEELLFRGAFFHHLRRRHGWWVSAVVVAVIFAAIHPQGWVAVPALSTIAVIMAGIREWRGSIVAPIAAHALNNGVLVTLMVFSVV